MKFIREERYGDKSCNVLYAVANKMDVPKVTREDVIKQLPINTYLNSFNCWEINVIIIWAEEIIYTCCGFQFEAIAFPGEGYRGIDFMYTLGRIRKKLIRLDK